MIPVWQDTYYTTTADTLNYQLWVDDSLIFSGRAYRNPNEGDLKIKINKICSDYLANNIPDFRVLPEGGLFVLHTYALRTFTLIDSDTQDELDSYDFLFCYDVCEDGELSGYINGHADPREKIMYTFYSEEGEEVEMTIDDMTEELYFDAGVSTWIADAMPYEGRTVHVGNSEFDVRYCGDYALYYLSAKGGWCSFLIEGKTEESDAVDSYYYNKSFNNTTLDFERGRYISEIKKSFKLHTGWLTDAQARNLAENLLESNKVYLHDLNADKIMPVVITNSNVEYKTYRNTRKLISYEIDVECSQSRIRR